MVTHVYLINSEYLEKYFRAPLEMTNYNVYERRPTLDVEYALPLANN